MTTKEFYNKNYVSDNEKDTLILMQEYARLKCEELLEIVAEKADTCEIAVMRGHETVVDIDSILNAVDLEKFCS